MPLMNADERLKCRLLMSSFQVRARCFAAAVLAAFLILNARSFGQAVVINEINPDPADKMRPTEFIEFHNPGAAPVDVSGWILDDAVDFVFPAGSVIPAGGYRAVAENPAMFQATYGFTPWGPWTGKLSNRGERIRLRTAAGVVVDEVNYGAGFPWPTAAFGAGASMELIHPSLDNDLGGSWRAASPAPVSPPLIAASAAGWKYKLGTAEASSPVDAWRQWNYDDSTGWTTGALPLGFGDIDGNAANTDVATTIATGTKTVFLRKAFTIAPGQVPAVIALRLRCDDGCIAFINGNEINPRVRIGAGAVPPYDAADGVATNAAEPPLAWEAEIVLGNAPVLLREGTNVLAVQLVNTTTGSSDLFVDAELKPPTPTASTPGAANTVFSTAVPPQIRQVAHTPQQPAAGQSVLITAKISDPNGVGAVTVAYQAVSPGAYIRKTDAAYATTWTNVAMRDDGLSGDALAADGVYSAIIPAAQNTHRRLMRYRITAVDSASNSVTVPYADDDQANFAYFVYNGAPAWTGAMRPASFNGFPATPADTYPAAMLNTIPPYHLIANATDVTNCQYNGSFNDVEFPGTMVYDGVVYDHIQFKNRGIGSTYVAGKNKFAFLFNRTRDFQPRDNWGRRYAATWNSFALNANAAPWAAVHRGSAGVEEALSYRIYELAGGLSLRTHYVHLRIIDDAAESGATQYDGDLWGLYLALEPTEGNFIDERGLASGNIYAIEGNNGDKKYQGDPPQPADGSDWTTFRAGVALNGQTEAFYRANEDLPNLYTFLGLNRLIGNVDVRPGDNYRYYHRPTDNRWVVVPYDLDMQFIPAHHWGGGMDGINVAGAPNTIRAIMRHPALAVEFRNRCRELLSLLASDASPAGGQIGQLVDEYAKLVNPAGQPLTWADLDAAMWNLHPRTAGGGANTGQSSHKGNFFRALYNDGPRGGLGGTVQTGTWIRQLADSNGDGFSDHEGLMQWFVNFATNTYPAGAPAWLRKAVTTGSGNDPSVDRQKGFGFKYLEWESLYGGFANANAEPATPDLSFPNKPAITYAGPAGFPANDLTFQSSTFSPSASGGTSFAAMQWRIGEVSAPGLPEYDPTEPRIYEIENVWTSPEITTFGATIRVPVTAARPGHTYRARVRHKDANGRWSYWSAPLQFVPSAPDVTVYRQSLVISEINYDPAPPSAGELAFAATDFEWIEVKNVSALPIDCTGVRFTKGVNFDFPGGYTIPAGGFALVARNLDAFQARWGHAHDAIIAGTFPNDSLNNAGEQLKLSYGAGTAIIDFVYSDLPPWPVDAAGTGKTLVLRNPAFRPDPALPGNWKASYAAGGTPGADEVINYAAWAASYPGVSDPLLDTDGDGLNDLLEYALMADPTQPSPGAWPAQSVQTYTVNGVPGDYLTLTVTHRNDGADLQYAVQFTADLTNAWLANGTLISATPGSGGTVIETWRAPMSLAMSPSQYGRLRVTKP
jgi:hypothetical protein